MPAVPEAHLENCGCVGGRRKEDEKEGGRRKEEDGGRKRKRRKAEGRGRKRKGEGSAPDAARWAWTARRAAGFDC